MRPQCTYTEDGAYWAVITLPNGHTVYQGPHRSRSTARRRALQETARHAGAKANHGVYNTRYLDGAY